MRYMSCMIIIYIYIYIYIYMHTHVYVCIHTHTHTHARAHTHTHTHTHTHYTHTYIYTPITCITCIYVYMYVMPRGAAPDTPRARHRPTPAPGLRTCRGAPGLSARRPREEVVAGLVVVIPLVFSWISMFMSTDVLLLIHPFILCRGSRPNDLAKSWLVFSIFCITGSHHMFI